MTVILDLDYTLLDTLQLKRAMEEAVADLGILPEHFQATYRRHPEKKIEHRHYQMDVHAATIEDIHGVPKSAVLERFAKAMDQLPKFLYPDTIPFLQYLRSKKITTALLTLGHPEFQSEKARLAKITELFDYLTFTEAGKHTVSLPYTDPTSEWIFVNDHIEELANLREVFPTATFYCLARHEQVVPKKGIEIFHTLREVESRLSVLLK